jgi:hypothetical protein
MVALLCMALRFGLLRIVKIRTRPKHQAKSVRTVSLASHGLSGKFLQIGLGQPSGLLGRPVPGWR